MKPTKHTPGPWNFSSRFDYRIDSQNGLGRSICLYLVDSETEQQDLANAQLISAAPELLAGLAQAVYFFEQNGGDDSYTWLPNLKAAIAKATGGHNE